ncbi:adenylosuccinate lyase [Salipiger sp.]|uniref:adenylosuccinate lyase n=1 Tax=Salipiger sp. TaxID=2078585 RepID=UPI003A96A83F
MTIKMLLTAAALVAAPIAAGAACLGHSEAGMTCAAGTVFDAESGTCKVVSG